MTEHLPECETYRKEIDYVCICGLLRACEQRVREGWYEIQSETWEQGYKYALDAAQEAVERVSTLFEPLGPALAAIDALRGES